MLLAKNMTADRRFDLNNGSVDVGEEIDVEVLSVDRARGRVMLRDLPKVDPEPVELAPAA
jgi:ribosomal protein S1